MTQKKPDTKLTPVRLRYIHRCTFVKSEATNFAEALVEWAQPGDPSTTSALAPGDVVLLVSNGGNQLVFVSGYVSWTSAGQAHSALDSRRLRLNGHWNPLMLADYAMQRGLHLIGLQKFETIYKAAQAEKIAKKKQQIE